MIELEDRVLFENGVSVISINKACEIIMERGDLDEHLLVHECPEALLYEEKYGVDITESIEELMISEQVKVLSSDDDWNGNTAAVSSVLCESNRFNTNRPPDIYEDRLKDEIKFFKDTGNIHLVTKLARLIKQFKKDGVVWGGRGSSCASLLLFYLEVHDVDPVKYNIPFREFSKQYEDSNES